MRLRTDDAGARRPRGAHERVRDEARRVLAGPYIVTETLNRIPGIVRFQLVQVSTTSFELRLATVDRKAFDEGARCAADAVREILGGCDVEAVYVPEVPIEPGRKYSADRALTAAELDLDQERVALAAAGADRRQPEPAATAAQLVHERREDARAGGADRVAERDRSAVDVHRLRIGAEHLAPSSDGPPSKRPR